MQKISFFFRTKQGLFVVNEIFNMLQILKLNSENPKTKFGCADSWDYLRYYYFLHPWQIYNRRDIFLIGPISVFQPYEVRGTLQNLKKIWRHPNMLKLTICGNLSSKALIKRQFLYTVTCFFSIFGGPPGTSSRHPAGQRHPGVNFINIFCAHSLYESELSSFSLITFGFAIFWCQNIGKKVARKMLIKLTPCVWNWKAVK